MNEVMSFLIECFEYLDENKGKWSQSSLMSNSKLWLLKAKWYNEGRVKLRFLQEWNDTVNQHGCFGKWEIRSSHISTDFVNLKKNGDKL